jgi:riboflavin biosynthesis pyrimidine reductase
MLTRTRPARRPGVTAAFTLSWDGRILEKGQPEMGVDEFRELLAAGGIDELCITWRPRLAGGKTLAPITGFDPAFLPCGIVFDLLKLRHKADRCLATYRVRRARP